MSGADSHMHRISLFMQSVAVSKRGKPIQGFRAQRDVVPCIVPTSSELILGEAGCAAPQGAPCLCLAGVGVHRSSGG